MAELSPFRFDPGNQCLWRRSGSGETQIQLTPTEFGVLDHLVEHAGQLVTHRELLDAIWPGVAIEPQVVKNKIFHLRKVLGDDPKQPRYIETLPRRGYRFIGRLERSTPVEGVGEAPSARLVGRDSVLAELWQAMGKASSGTVQVVFITGEPGIGKTALTEEFQRHVSSSSRMRLTRGQCVEGFGSKEAFFPVLEAVGRLCRGPEGARVVDTLATAAPTWLVQFPALLTRQHRETLRQEILGATKERMLREICDALAVLSARSPMLLVLEDLHWADTSTLDLMSVLARHRARVMLLGTYRATELAESTLPLDRVKRDLVARQLGREIVLLPLSESEIAEYLVEGQSTTAVPQELAALLHLHTEGNPLFMTAVLSHLLEAGLVERDRSTWRLRRPATEITLQVPDSLREMIGAQIERLGAMEQRVLEVAAIAGMTFTPAIRAPTAYLDIAAFDETCDALARRNHIVRLAGTQTLPDGQVVQRYQFVHALYREALYERQAPAHRAMLHRRGAERIAELFAARLDEVAPELAHHFELGADWRRAVRYLGLVAEVAGKGGATTEAKAKLEHALTLAARLPPAERAEAEVEILDALLGISLSLMEPGAIDTAMRLRERAAEHGLIDLEVRALVDMAYPLSWTASERAIEVIGQALRLGEAQQDPLMRARTRARCMVRRITAGGWQSADADDCRKALAEIRRAGSREDAAWDTIDSAWVELLSSEYRTAHRDTGESLAVLKASGDPHHHLSYIAAHRLCEYVAPWSLMMAGEWGAALGELDASLALAERNADRYGGGTLRLLRCLAQILGQDFAGAHAGCAVVAPGPEHLRPAFPRHFWLTVEGAAAAGLGEVERALEGLRMAGEEMERQPQLLDWYWQLPRRWTLTGLWLARGELDCAREEGERLLTDACATAERTWQGLAWDVNARVALARGDVQQARDQIKRGLAAIDGVEAPVAGWQLHATAAETAAALGQATRAEAHRKSSRDIVLLLAASLDGHEASQRTFLVSPAVVRVLDPASSLPA